MIEKMNLQANLFTLIKNIAENIVLITQLLLTNNKISSGHRKSKPHRRSSLD